jgi:hypothetical protein
MKLNENAYFSDCRWDSHIEGETNSITTKNISLKSDNLKGFTLACDILQKLSK